MKQFEGFPARMEFTPIPNMFFSSLLPEINDIAELKTTLHIFSYIYRKRGYPRFTTYHELSGNTSLMKSLGGGEKPPDEVLGNALDKAVDRGTILHIVLDRDGAPEDIYFLNTESDRQVVARIRNGELTLSGLKAGGRPSPDVQAEQPPNIFTLYEQNIGMLTPMISEELREAEKLYPEGWIKDAFKEAVSRNVRKWSYIAAILERWLAEGRDSGTYKRDTKKTDPDKYIKGKYGHRVRR
jgi:DnaD/phage-associated family protein